VLLTDLSSLKFNSQFGDCDSPSGISALELAMGFFTYPRVCSARTQSA
jgi:hypothetical protein